MLVGFLLEGLVVEELVTTDQAIVDSILPCFTLRIGLGPHAYVELFAVCQHCSRSECCRLGWA